MRNGTHAVYVIEMRCVAQSDHGQPNGPIKPMKEPWAWSRYNTFDAVMNPHVGTGNDWRPQNPKADKEWHDTRHACCEQGWYTLRFAIAALKRARKANDEGKGNHRDGYGKCYQTARYEFRLVKKVVTYSKTETELTVNDVVEAMA
jgi:hypothetical protein